MLRRKRANCGGIASLNRPRGVSCRHPHNFGDLLSSYTSFRLSAQEIEMSAKKSTNSKKPVVDKVKRTRKPNALHDKLEKLFTQKGG